MHTEFENVDLNLIRYSLVWEGYDTLYNAMDITPKDDLLMVTSAGCNVLNALLKQPRSLTSIDLNPEQNRLLLLKTHIIEHLEHDVLISLMGFNGMKDVAGAWESVAPALEPTLREHWEDFFAKHPGGIISAGKLETYIHHFLPGLPEELQKKVRHLLSFTETAAQYEYFLTNLEKSEFKARFIEYFDQQNLSKGRDPQLFKYVKESGGELFYNRLKVFISNQLVRDNFYFRFFMFGPEEIPEIILPPCYRKENFLKLRAQLPKLNIVTGEAVEYLLSPEGQKINKAGLSNIFEYVSQSHFEEVCANLFTMRKLPLRMVYWNLLQSQGETTCLEFRLEGESNKLTRKEACFYFMNVRVMESVPHSILK
ncbi:DUF3419 family protein [Antarcticibacterium arcticum]|uniref:DUF3419 family protein n=1 Tax=Antarcticibacterium arcticum TaxID=2585771 RepID=A0A5B8YP44_9FLAO|nr:DUF3419 family protein [Antarcticibacterium arcticum]QED38647.1 DUF3419 family protein [Antarcticibacterium arcticum]